KFYGTLPTAHCLTVEETKMVKHEITTESGFTITSNTDDMFLDVALAFSLTKQTKGLYIGTVLDMIELRDALDSVISKHNLEENK
ncbi:hypothetical protein LCGC14_2720180, partial [marine sediment metagenome]